MRRRHSAAVTVFAAAWVFSGCATAPEYLPPAGPVSAGSAGPAPAGQVLVIGDEYTSGTRFGGLGRHNWTAVLQQRAAQDGVEPVLAVWGRGGAGYLARGVEGASFGAALDSLAGPDTRAIVLFGAIADVSATGDVGAAVAATCGTARRLAPRARIAMVGPAWTPPYVHHTRMTHLREILGREAKRCGAEFVDPIAGRWAGPNVLGSDRSHPTNAGHQVLADRMYPVVKSLLRGRA